MSINVATGNELASIAPATNKTADTEWITPDLALVILPGRALRIYICISVATAGKFEMTFDGGTTWDVLNNGKKLSASTLYSFEIPVSEGETINFRAKTTTDINHFMVYQQR